MVNYIFLLKNSFRNDKKNVENTWNFLNNSYVKGYILTAASNYNK